MVYFGTDWFCGSRKWEGPAALGGERIASEHTHPALWVEDYELVLAFVGRTLLTHIHCVWKIASTLMNCGWHTR